MGDDIGVGGLYMIIEKVKQLTVKQIRGSTGEANAGRVKRLKSTTSNE